MCEHFLLLRIYINNQSQKFHPQVKNMKPPTKSPFQLLIVFALLMLYYSPPLVLGQLVINGYTIEPGANLMAADLSDANLTGSDLKDADLTRSDLRFADLSGSNLSNANLSDATLSRANLSDTNLSDANLSDALYDQNTQFPTDFDPSTTAMLLVTSATQTAGSSSINLIQGIDMIVLPFQTETAYTAKTLAQHLAGNNDNLNDDSTVDVTWVIRYHLIN